MKSPRLLILPLISAVCIACTSLPPESYELSKTIGKEIDESRDAHASMLDSFYGLRSSTNDEWVTATFLPRLLAVTKEGLKEACEQRGDASPSCSALTERDLGRLLAKVVTFRDDMQRALEANRLAAANLIDEHYASLRTGNSTLTAFIESAVDLDKARQESVATFSEATGIEIDTAAINTAFDEFLAKAGTVGAGIESLESALDTIIKDSDESANEGETP